MASIVIYLRSLTPVRNLLARTEVAFPVKYLIRSVPQPLTGLVPQSNGSNPVERGAFLVNVAGCADCTRHKNGTVDTRFGLLRRPRTRRSVGPDSGI